MRWLGWCAAFLVLHACRCGTGTVSSRYGDLVVVQKSLTGREVLVKEATVPLPPAFMGEVVITEIPARNVGVEEVSIASVTRLEGDESISLDGAVGLTFDTEADGTIPIRFAPPQDANATVASLTHRARFSVKITGARPGEDELILEVTADGIARDCFVPALVDFGAVPLRSAINTTFPLVNGGAISTTTTFGPLEGADAPVFELGVTGSVDVPAGTTVDVRARFSPLEERAYSVTTKVRRSPACPEGTLELRGRGDDGAFSWSPSRLDFGRLPLGVAVRKSVTVINGSNVALGVSGVVADPNFRLDAAPTTIPPLGTAVFDVSCAPIALGPLVGELTLSLATETTTLARIPLTCSGGGPRIRVDPNPLLFGAVPLNETTKRRIIVQNVGTAPSMPGDASLNLLLGGPGGALPWFAVVPKNAQTNATEFGVGIRSTYDPLVGVPAVAGANLIEFEVTLRPTGPVDVREADLLVYSNDAVTPVVRIPLTASPRARESCAVNIDPGNFDFGRTSRGVSLSRTVFVENLNPDPSNTCLISGIELAPGSDLAFRVVEPANGSLLVPGNTRRPIIVTAIVPQNANIGDYLRGAVRLHASGAMVDRSLPVDLLVSQCLVVDPVNVNVGLVQAGCVSAGRAITLYNVCGTPLTVNGIASIPPPFNLVQAPAFPINIAPGASVTVSINAAPTAPGSFSGIMQFDTADGMTPVTLQGTSDLIGAQTDAFTQSAGQTDILLVVDNSCSMGDEQAALANNFAAFISSATASSGDWRIGVITTDNGERGLLRRVAGEPTVLSSSTPQVASLFSSRVSVGISGSGFEMPFESMELALTEPNKSGANAGFLRQDAFLAVVIITDALEQSPNSVGSYLTSLRNAKGGRRELASVSVVGPFSPTSATCSTEGSIDDGRFHNAVSVTGGVEADICTQNWAMDLENVSRSVFGSRRSFELTGTARGSSDITVTIDGMPTTAWTWDAANNSVIFVPPPQTGANISVTYRTACF